MYLLLPIFFAIEIGIPVEILLWIARRRDKRKARRGFEVILTNEATVRESSEKERD